MEPGDSNRLRILYLAPCRPEGLAFGTQLRALHVARVLREVGDVHFVVTGFPDEDRPGAGNGEFPVDRFLPLEPVPARPAVERVRCWIDPRFINITGHRVGPGDRDWLERHMDGFDLVWLHHLKNANRFERWAWPKSVLDIDDVPSTYLRTQARNAPGAGRRLHAWLRMQVARRREGQLGRRFGVLAVCSEADRRHLALRAPVHVIPNGFDAPERPFRRRPVAPPRIGFIGVFNYEPNREGVRWFAEHCWPRIRRVRPDAELRLIGRHTDGEGKPAGEGIRGLGWLEDAGDEMAGWSLMIVPVRLGAGTRVKIAEGFSKRIPMVATPLGAFGYDVASGRELWMADNAEDFAGACLRVLDDPDGAEQMAERGWRRFLDEWTWEAIRPRILAAAEDGLRRAGVRGTAGGGRRRGMGVPHRSGSP